MRAPQTFAASTLFGLLMAGTAQAALTGDQVWARWQESAAVVGLSLAAEGTTTEGDSLRLTNVTVRAALPTDGSDVEGTIAEVVMTTQSDGSVAITVSPEVTVPLLDVGGTLAISHSGLVITATGDPAAVTYDFTAASLAAKAIADVPVDVGDGTEQSTSFDIGVTSTNPKGSYSDALGASRLLSVALDADELTLTIKSNDALSSMSNDQVTNLTGVALAMTADIPAAARLMDIDSAVDMSALLNDGLAVTLEMTQEASSGTDKSTSPFFSYELTNSGLPGSARMSFDKTGFVVAGGGEGGNISGTSDMLPVPVSLTFGAIDMDFRMPVAATEAQDFKYMVSLKDLVVNEEAWGLIDPGQTLPRDPASLEIDASGKATLDLFALMAAEEAGVTDIAPPTIDSLDIRSIALSIAGAAIAGKGAFTFDNATAMPVPLGTADVTVTGANGLIDKLVALGLITEEDVSGARMMMSMFLTPGEGDDVLTSTIEAKEGGSVFVNGMQVQ